MIIVSQDKKTIANFNTIETIQIDDNVLDKTEAEFEILANGETLGYYKTEERAKEVLKEIVLAHSNFKIAKAVEGTNKDLAISMIDINYEYFDTYEMPAE